MKKNHLKNSPKYFSSRAGFTLPEVMMALGIITIVLGLSFFIFHQAAGSFQETDLTSHLTERLQNGLNILRKDLRETGMGTISYLPLSGYDGNFPDSHAWTMATARDKTGVFRTDVSGRSVWQGVIVYCPHKEAADKPWELRRYAVYYDFYTFPFTFDNITHTTITIRDQGAPSSIVIDIDRATGSVTTTPSGKGTTTDPVYRVGANMVARATITQMGVASILYRITLKTEGVGRADNILSRELSTYVHPRN